jgi:uncharacterized protein YlaI
MPREIVQLAPGRPEVLALKYPTGRPYGDRVLFSLSDERILYLDHDEAKELEGLGIRAFECPVCHRRTKRRTFGAVGSGSHTADAGLVPQHIWCDGIRWIKEAESGGDMR